MRMIGQFSSRVNRPVTQPGIMGSNLVNPCARARARKWDGRIERHFRFVAFCFISRGFGPVPNRTSPKSPVGDLVELGPLDLPRLNHLFVREQSVTSNPPSRGLQVAE